MHSLEEVWRWPAPETVTRPIVVGRVTYTI